MSLVTSTWLIPYPEATDRLCDGYLFTQDIAERVDELLDEFDLDLASVEVIPLARVSTVISQITSTASTTEVPVTFNTIDFDTTGLASLNNPTAPLLIEPEERYISGGEAIWTEAGGVAGDEYLMDLIAASGSTASFFYAQRDAGTNATMRAVVSTYDTSGVDEDLIGLRPSHSGTPGTRTVSRAMAWIMKVTGV